MLQQKSKSRAPRPKPTLYQIPVLKSLLSLVNVAWACLSYNYRDTVWGQCVLFLILVFHANLFSSAICTLSHSASASAIVHNHLLLFLCLRAFISYSLKLCSLPWCSYTCSAQTEVPNLWSRVFWRTSWWKQVRSLERRHAVLNVN